MSLGISNTTNVVDFRDVIERMEELQDTIFDALQSSQEQAKPDKPDDPDEDEEEPKSLAEQKEDMIDWLDDLEPGTILESIMKSALSYVQEEIQEYVTLNQLKKDIGTDDATLIHESYFQTYAEQLAEDIGAISRDTKWPLNHIDWEAAAEELKSDYSTVDWNGETYYWEER